MSIDCGFPLYKCLPMPMLPCTTNTTTITTNTATISTFK